MDIKLWLYLIRTRGYNEAMRVLDRLYGISRR